MLVTKDEGLKTYLNNVLNQLSSKHKKLNTLIYIYHSLVINWRSSKISTCNN